MSKLILTNEVAGLGGGGAKLVTVADGSPAAVAGLQPGDIVLGIDARFVTSSSDLVVALRSHEPGDAVAISYRRGCGHFSARAPRKVSATACAIASGVCDCTAR